MAVTDGARLGANGYRLPRKSLVRERAHSFFREPLDFTKPRVVLGWVALHIVLGLISHVGVIFSTFISATLALILLGVSLRCSRLLTLVMCACYAGIGDTWWRMSQAKTPWEQSKILFVIICLIGLVRFVGPPKNVFFPAAYFLLLLPASVPIFFTSDFSSARSQWSFIIGGPVVLALGTVFFKQIRTGWSSVEQVVWCMIGPVVACASIASQATQKLDALAFKNAVSNDAVAAGFGANQVSDLLGFGMLLVFFLALQEKRWANRVIALGLGMWFFSQAAVTLSRGGLFSFGLALLVAIPNIIAHRRLGLRFLVAAFVVVLLVILIVFPRLETFTGGAVGKRSQDTSSTLRGKLVQSDLEVFKQHLVFGVGVSKSNKYHKDVAYGLALASHTEFSRMVAEHGLLGVAAILCMIAMAAQAYFRQNNSFGKAWTIAMVTWSAVTMSHSATRIAVICMSFAMASLAIDDEEPEITWGERRLQRRKRQGELDSAKPSIGVTAAQIARRREQFQARRSELS